jgi:very-short-patch-repair endonuclease
LLTKEFFSYLPLFAFFAKRGREEGALRKPKDARIQKNARKLRHQQTDAENILWRELRMHQLDGIHFRRQHAIGNYIVDFCALKGRLIIELDGGQHLEHEEYDLKRTAYLESQGYRVLRFWDHEVLQDLDIVLQVIFDTLHGIDQASQKEPPPPSPI